MQGKARAVQINAAESRLFVGKRQSKMIYDRSRRTCAHIEPGGMLVPDTNVWRAFRRRSNAVGKSHYATDELCLFGRPGNTSEVYVRWRERFAAAQVEWSPDGNQKLCPNC